MNPATRKSTPKTADLARYDYHAIFKTNIDGYIEAASLANQLREHAQDHGCRKSGLYEEFFKTAPIRKDLERRLIGLQWLGEERRQALPFEELYVLYNFIPHDIYDILSDRYRLHRFDAEEVRD